MLRGNGVGTSTWAQVNLGTDVTGTLATSLGGTGTTSSTGTGSVVLSTAPTLSGPTINTGGTWNGAPTLQQPTITDYTNADHDHSTAPKGGSLGNSVITAQMIAAGCVIGISGTGLNPIPASNTDVTGTSLTFSVAVACYMSITMASGELQTNVNNNASVFLNVDGVNQSAKIFQSRASDTAGTELHTSPAIVFPRIALSVGSHTIKMQAVSNTTSVAAMNGVPGWWGIITNQN